MAGTNLAGQLSGTSFSMATRHDDPEIRRLLRENPMGGSVSISMRQEPDYFLESERMPGRQHSIVARAGERIVAVGSCAIRPRFIGGSIEEVGYLRTLRLDRTVAGRFDILRRGYRFLHECCEEWRAACYFTSVAAENRRAIRFLERALPGMPRYRFLCEYVTLMIPVKGTNSSSTIPCDLAEVANFLNERNRRTLSPAWNSGELASLQSLGLQPSDFAVVREEGRIVACGALWDQRFFKQTVIHRYRFPIWLQRFLFNLAAPVLRQPGMPAPKTICPFGCLSHFAADASNVELLIRKLQSIAAGKGVRFLCLGVASGSPLLNRIQSRFYTHEYRSRLYQVEWPDLPSVSIPRGDLNPDIALL